MEQSRWEAISGFLFSSKWLKPAAMALAAVALVQVFAIQPLKRQVVELRVELANMHSAVNRLADAGDQAWQTNDLLGALEMQAEKMEVSVGSLRCLEELQVEIAGLAQLAEQARMQLGPSRETIAELSRLENEITAHADQIAAAESAIAEIESMQTALLEQGDNAHAAREVVDRHASLTQSILADRELVVAAEEQVRGFRSLTSGIVAAGDSTAEAEAVVSQFMAMQETLLGGDQSQLAQARQNLQDLIALEDSLAGETDRIADAVISLELMADFQEEFHFQVTQLEGMQQSLTQLILLESSVARAVRMIEPLAELTDLRRLDDDEVREAARIILDRRESRLSALPDDGPRVEEMEEPPVDRLVPIPPEE